MIILGIFLFPLSKYKDSKDKYKEFQMKIMLHHRLKLHVPGMRKMLQCSLKMFYNTVGVKMGKRADRFLNHNVN